MVSTNTTGMFTDSAFSEIYDVEMYNNESDY